tara:strand:+ start:770 stop:1300 length:531 start_codon:yes stop_codon:yes gene_type:complete
MTILISFCVFVVSVLAFLEAFIYPSYVTIDAVVVSSHCPPKHDGHVDCQIIVRESGHDPDHRGGKRKHSGGHGGKHVTDDPRWHLHASYAEAEDAPREGASVKVYKKVSDGSVSLTPPLMTPERRKQVRVISPIVGVVAFAVMVAYFRTRNDRSWRNTMGGYELANGIDTVARVAM